MKKPVFSMALLFCVCHAFACTNLIVGRKASQDGSVFVSYSADSYGMYGNMYRHVGGTHSKGEMRKIYDWDTNKYLGEIPQVQRTYNVVGQMNEHQVSICETTFGGRSELVDPQGLIDYGSLIYIALERSVSARDAIAVMTGLVASYGYYSEGETFTIADKNEVWVMEMVGMGPGSKNAAWVAVRIPDDCISAHANQSRITRYFSLYPKGDVLYNKDNVKFARSKGLFSGKDSEFSFRDAFNAPDFSGVRFCDARVWSFFNRHVDGMDKYLPYINGENLKDEMPLYVRPKQQVSLQQLKDDMRDHYEGTPLDITGDLGSGAYGMLALQIKKERTKPNGRQKEPLRANRHSPPRACAARAGAIRQNTQRICRTAYHKLLQNERRSKNDRRYENDGDSASGRTLRAAEGIPQKEQPQAEAVHHRTDRGRAGAG